MKALKSSKKYVRVVQVTKAEEGIMPKLVKNIKHHFFAVEDAVAEALRDLS